MTRRSWGEEFDDLHADLDAIDAEVDAIPDEHVARRLRELPADAPERSVMRELLGDEESDRFEIAPGRWHLPGPPP